MKRFLVAAAVAGVLALPVVAATQTKPASLAGCPPGQTGVIYGCTPFCLPGKELDLQTGLCLPPPPPPPPTPRY